jgi:NADPH:quinone reductase-like Zn-dependent oxidoreductase
MSIQLAKLAGAFVYAVAGNDQKAQLAKKLGADVVLDRSRVDWGKEIYKLTEKRGVDVVVDNVGKATLTASMQALARGGRIVIVGSTMGSHQNFKEVVGMLWAGKLRPVIDSVMPLSAGRAAYEKMERGELLGKIVLTP